MAALALGLGNGRLRCWDWDELLSACSCCCRSKVGAVGRMRRPSIFSNANHLGAGASTAGKQPASLVPLPLSNATACRNAGMPFRSVDKQLRICAHRETVLVTGNAAHPVSWSTACPVRQDGTRSRPVTGAVDRSRQIAMAERTETAVEALKNRTLQAGDHGDLAQRMPDSSPTPLPSTSECLPRTPRLIGRGEQPELARFQTHLQHPLLQALSKSPPAHVSSIAWQCVQKKRQPVSSMTNWACCVAAKDAQPGKASSTSSGVEVVEVAQRRPRQRHQSPCFRHPPTAPRRKTPLGCSPRSPTNYLSHGVRPRSSL